MNLNDHIRLWNQASLKVLDIRHAALELGEELRSYQLPASAFLFSMRGRARIRLDGMEHRAESCYLCHAGKGTFLDIDDIAEPFEYYFIFYKATLSLPARQELVQLLERSKPFHVQYGFAPLHHAALYLKIVRMKQEWKQAGTLEKLRTKSLFYQLICELLGQLHDQEIATIVPDVAAQAIRYLDEYYAEPVTLEMLSELLQCSPRQLQRLFKARYQAGPIDYLIQVRMQKAQELLLGTDAALKDISAAVGYPDSYYFSRIFKKHVGISPSSFKMAGRQAEASRHYPFALSRYAIAARKGHPYSGKGSDENHYQYQYRGARTMYSNRSFKAGWTVSLLLSLTLLLAACSGATGANTNAGGGASAPSNSITASPTVSDAGTKAGAPRTIKHMKGELKLEQTPQRIAVLDTQFMDQLIALGEQPSGSVVTESENLQFPTYMAGKLVDVAALGTLDEPNLEAIVALEPDIIIGTEFHDKIYDQLVKIAPTLIFERNEDWQITLKTFGSIMDKELEAQQVLDQYNSKVAGLKAKLSEKYKDQTFALLRPRDNIIRLHTTSHRTAALLYNDLGLTPPSMAVDADNSSASLALEKLPELEADYLFVLEDKNNLELTKEFESSAIWKNLKAVKDGHVYKEDTNLWIAYYGPVAINLVLDHIDEALN
ncbi:iron complex transport system substrate-binding protein [Paenibacillus algorifonticola]|uniref:Iron complex transport system substrate-binding protein n=1 Tax=Paenibacillus algorifonticola TaxID=684063 RepID=A0A1I2HV47_9BACL|nr:AraC family transcriptional regulator [Paenibacillus algorifonticola]SFF33819.1 iron complex transport system substrate-binding protein [Paenibacillus algorifonticola]